ncbi:phage baseplate assembly protein [Sphingomonas sp. S-NIH.Pt15_0812]|uniref:phage baseplate assembly protein n=1 Tax=Sphingomonas sp. S-NIH.Pt15_0812 TaxID=1920129 RepID=UPI000F7F8E36|nr:contractile injection system protein, VgrG/Pvc8 family [Sphingomonas sp. S-NIH.Pt15_0812]RSU46348.1 hypothetical protein BRX43_15925 [Sphingomonas sp. S-NIH.Pt15_0812]
MTAGVVTIVTESQNRATSAADEIQVSGGRRLTGWMDVAITLRAEAFPNDWSLTATSATPAGDKIAVAEGDFARILIDDDIVVTGYVDRVATGGDRQDHRVALIGRGRTQDLVDCSAEWEAGGQILSATALEIVTRLAEPYGVEVALGDGASAGDPVPQFNLTYGETPAAIIQRLARNAGLLAYEAPDGRLLLAAAGSTRAASGIAYGVNVEAYNVTRSMDQRMSEIVCAWAGQDLWSDLGEGGFFFHTERDPGVRRHRRLYLVLEQSALGQELTIRKARWETARRAGRALAVEVTIDSWRDTAGRLWLPNTLVDVDLPGAKASLCIAEVQFIRNSEEGTIARLYLLPPEAFQPEPISLSPVNLNDIQAAP